MDHISFPIQGIVVLGFIFIFYAVLSNLDKCLRRKIKINRAVQNLTALRLSLIKHGHKSTPDFSDLSTESALKNSLFPFKLLQNNKSKALNEWDGEINIAVGATARTFTITYAKIPKNVCATLATAQAGLWESVSVNGIVMDQDSEMITQIDAVTQKSNTIIFTSN